jgi:hypothetical protein
MDVNRFDDTVKPIEQQRADLLDASERLQDDSGDESKDTAGEPSPEVEKALREAIRSGNATRFFQDPKNPKAVEFNVGLLQAIFSQLGPPPSSWTRGHRRRLAKKLGIPWPRFQEIVPRPEG